MKKFLILISLCTFSLTNCYAAKPITCPPRPGFITCPGNVVTLNSESSGWQSRINIGQGSQCTDHHDYRFKFDTAEYNSKTYTLECFYLATNQAGKVISALSLSTKNYRNSSKETYSHWQLDSDCYDCGQKSETRLRNCPIEALENIQ